MSWPAAPPRPAPGHPEPAASGPHIEAVLARPGWRLRFPRPLEQEYERDSLALRAKQMIALNVLGGGSFWLLSRQVADQLGAFAKPGAVLRWAVIGLILTLALINTRQVVQRRPRIRRSVELTTTIGSATITAWIFIAAHFGADLLSTVKPGGLLLVIMYSSILARQQFRYVVAVDVYVLAGYVLLARSEQPLGQVVIAGNLRLFFTAVLFTLCANFMMERRERRAYLLRRLDVERRTALSESALALTRLSVCDALTGLANRRSFDAQLKAAWHAGSTRDVPVALLHVDVDFFKRYNDMYGHPAGDGCLQSVARALATVADRNEGFVARVGGEEFSLLLPGRDVDAAARVAAQVCTAVVALGVVHDGSAVAGWVTVSVGVAALRPGCTEPAMLLRAADRALYAAKRAGRDQFACAAAVLTPARFDVVTPRTATAVAASDAAVSPATPDIDRIAQLNELQAGRRSVRLPGDLARMYHEGDGGQRRWVLALLGLGGLLFSTGYLWLSRPMLPGIADPTWHRVLVLDAVLVAPVAALALPMRWWWREALFTASGIVLAVGLLAAVAPSGAVTVPSWALSLVLIPMFTAIVAAQPFGLSVVASTVIWLASAVLLYPAPDGQYREVWLYCTVLQLNALLFTLLGGYLLDSSRRRTFVLSLLEQAQRSALLVSNSRLQTLAMIDALTGMFNRRQFEADYDRLWAECAAGGQPLGLLILDIDHFKGYNDGYGHPAGDECLRQVGTELAGWTAAQAAMGGAPGWVPVAARLGGEEFGVLLPGADLAGALAVAEQLRARLRDLAIVHLHSPVADRVTVSIGAASLDPTVATDSRLLLRLSDAALYRAKSHGRDQVAA